MVILSTARLLDGIVVFSNIPYIFKYGLQRTWYRDRTAQGRDKWRAGNNFFYCHVVICILSLLALGFSSTIGQDDAVRRKALALILALILLILMTALVFAAWLLKRKGKLSARSQKKEWR